MSQLGRLLLWDLWPSSPCSLPQPLCFLPCCRGDDVPVTRELPVRSLSPVSPLKATPPVLWHR